MTMYKTTFLISAFLISSPAFAAQAIYPAGGQSPEQQKQDEAACYSWAVENSGYDPANPQVVQAAPQSSGPSGARVRGAARGAVVGEITHADTGNAAIAGAVVGGSRERRARRGQQAQAQAAAQESGQTAFNNARAACLEGKGYSVK